jgi:hypothetical protein
MGVFDEKGKPARRHVWAVAWISGGAMLAAYLPSPTNGSDLGAAKASLVDVRDTREAPLPEASEELVGLDEKRAIELLGSPMTTEDRAPASIWHYKNSGCELELIFYMEMRTGLMRTLHFDFKGSADNGAQRQACLTAIMQGNSKGVPGNKLPEKDIMAESPTGNEVPPALAETSTENDLPPAPETEQQVSRREPHVRRGYVRHRLRWYTARGGGGYTLALRNYSGWSSGAAALTIGWGGGQFGPPPYSASGP